MATRDYDRRKLAPKPIRSSVSEPGSERAGILLGISAYILWGLLPLYWRQLSSVSAMQILAHRICWAFLFTTALTVLTKKTTLLLSLLKSPKKLAGVAMAGFLVSFNWGLYIWAVNAGKVLETSMGYYLNPLVSVLLGVFVLKEKIDGGIRAASAIAAAGIVVLTVSYGALPWVALALALSFAVYSLAKKMLGLDSIVGLMAETAAISPFALAYLLYEHSAGRGAFLHAGASQSLLLAMTGVVTATPLLLFSSSVKRMRLSRIGFLQYISPSLQLMLGVFVFKETVDGIKLFAFACVIAALVVFALSRGGVRQKAKKT